MTINYVSYSESRIGTQFRSRAKTFIIPDNMMKMNIYKKRIPSINYYVIDGCLLTR